MPNNKGNWEEDKEKFIKFQKNIEDLAKLTDVDTEY